MTLRLDAGQPVAQVDDFAQQKIKARVELVFRLTSRPSNRVSKAEKREFKSLRRPLLSRIPISTVMIVGTLASARTSI
jgi:hypothetical protein